MVDKLGYGAGKEAEKVIGNLPPFTPGQDALGRPVRVRFTLLIRLNAGG